MAKYEYTGWEIAAQTIGFICGIAEFLFMLAMHAMHPIMSIFFFPGIVCAIYLFNKR